MSPSGLKLVKASVAFMSLGLVLGIILLVWGMIDKSRQLGAKPAEQAVIFPMEPPISNAQNAPIWNQKITLQAGEEILEIWVDGGVIFTHIDGADDNDERMILRRVDNGGLIGILEIQQTE